MSNLPVSRLMQPCASATITLSTPLREAAERVLVTGLSTLPVVDEFGCFAGIVAETALIRLLMLESSHHATVGSIISRHVHSARSDAPLRHVLPLFRSAGQTTITIVDSENAPVGLLHRRDVIRYLLDDGNTTWTSATEAGSPRLPVHRQNRPHFQLPTKAASVDCSGRKSS